MGISYHTCNYCGDAFPDVVDYKKCECGYRWCSIECAEQEGYKCVDTVDEYEKSCGFCRDEIEEMFEVTESQKKILDIVMKYAEKHKDMWGINEYVHQNDDAQVDAIDLFSQIIGALPEQEDEDE